MEAKVNCFLKRTKGESVRRPKYVSGSDPSACAITPPVTTTTERIVESIDSNEVDEPVYNENEINGKFKIMTVWDQKLDNPESEEFKSLARTIENDLEDMLRKERDLSDQVESFTVKVQKFRKGSVVCDFKVNYILKEAYIAIPFAIKPANITNIMGNNFKFKKGILFQRFLIAGGSFNATSPVDHCAAKGCSHKCNYDYDVEDYICTCPRTLTLDSDGLNCVSQEEVTELYNGPKEDGTESTTKPEIELSFLPSDCLWGPWSDWDQCSVTCGQGQRQRTRTVAIPAKNGGSCEGDTEEFVDCEFTCDDQTETTTQTEVTEDVDIGRADDVPTTTEKESMETTAIDETTISEQPEVKVVYPDEEAETVSELPDTTTTLAEEPEATTGSVDVKFGDKVDETTAGVDITEEATTTEAPVEDETEVELTTPALSEADTTTSDVNLIFPADEVDATTEDVVMTEDTGITIAVDEDELNPTESSVSSETTTASMVTEVETSSLSEEVKEMTTLESVTAEPVKGRTEEIPMIIDDEIMTTEQSISDTTLPSQAITDDVQVVQDETTTAGADEDRIMETDTTTAASEEMSEEKITTTAPEDTVSTTVASEDVAAITETSVIKEETTTVTEVETDVQTTTLSVVDAVQGDMTTGPTEVLRPVQSTAESCIQMIFG